MATFDTSAVGKVDDVVRLQLGGSDVMICENYDVHSGILQQPSAFTLRLGKGDTILNVIRASPPRTPFNLLIGGVPQFQGWTDGFEAEGSTGATTLVVSGRDTSAELHCGEFSEAVSYTNLTYKQLAEAMLARVDLPDAKVFTDNAANRKIRAGVGVVTASEPEPDPDVIGNGAGVPPPDTIIRAKVNEKYARFMRRHFDRAGVMFWSASGPWAPAIGSPQEGNGSFCLFVPNGAQTPLYRFARRRGMSSNQVNILSAKYKVNTAGRFTACEVHSRSPGKKSGRAIFKGAYIDDEMGNAPLKGYEHPAGYGYTLRDGITPLRFHAYRDVNVTDENQAETYARRKAMEARRAGWSLEYEIAGHTCPSLVSNDRAVIIPDTVALVQDDELGLNGNYYVESVRYKRSGSGTTTTVKLMRLVDLIFGSTE